MYICQCSYPRPMCLYLYPYPCSLCLYLYSLDGPVITRPNVSDLPVFKDYQEVLVCEAEGNPKPEIIWIFNNKSIKGGNLTIGTEMAGLIHCRASNEVDVATKTVKLVFKGNNLHFSHCLNVLTHSSLLEMQWLLKSVTNAFSFIITQYICITCAFPLHARLHVSVPMCPCIVH